MGDVDSGGCDLVFGGVGGVGVGLLLGDVISG